MTGQWLRRQALPSSPNHLGWYPHRYAERRKAFCNHASCPNHGTFTNLYSGQNHNPGSNPDVASDPDRTRWALGLLIDRNGRIFEFMAARHDYHVGPHQNVVADINIMIDFGVRPNLCTISHLQGGAVSEIGMLLDIDARSARAKDA